VIPTTVISTIHVHGLMDFSLNMMSMLALTISVGMIIDDTIVVLENTYRHMQEGKSRLEAARVAIAEIGFAVIATSLAIGACSFRSRSCAGSSAGSSSNSA
jgi:hydrophobic/amphiphilic exporter-1 (mainly G- bacteria), HAE1 family